MTPTRHAAHIPAARGYSRRRPPFAAEDRVAITTFDPPLTFTPRPVSITVNGLYPTCTDPEAFNGSYSETFTLTASCTTLFDAGTATRTVVWGTPTAEPTTFDCNVVTNAVGGQVITLLTPNILQWLGWGVTSVTGRTVLTISQP